MSISATTGRRAVPCRTLAQYLELLLGRLGEADPAAVGRIRQVVGPRRARITLDEESVDVSFAGDRFVVEPAGPVAVSGAGATTRAVVLDLLDGFREVTAAVLDGDLELAGTVEDVAAIGQAIELLIDASVRAPALQALARDFRDDPCRPPSPSPPPPRRLSPRRTPFYPDAPIPTELAVLRRRDLLP